MVKKLVRTRKNIVSSKKNRLNLGNFSDDFVLGIVCAKTGLVSYALKTLKVIANFKKRRNLFMCGVRESEEYPLEDIAQDLWETRQDNPKTFDSLVLSKIGKEKFEKIKEAIANRPKHKHSFEVINELERLLNYEK